MIREEANLTIDYLKGMQESYIEGEGYERHPLPEWYALDKAIKALEREPNDKYIKEIDHLHKYIAKLETRIVEQDSVLDDVSAEIEEIETYDSIYIDRAYVLQIIDKYKIESEDK